MMRRLIALTVTPLLLVAACALPTDVPPNFITNAIINLQIYDFRLTIDD